MSEQGDGSYSDGGYGAGATGADAFAADEGVDQNYLGAPQGDGLDRIHARMDEMTAQQQAIVEALQTGYGDGYEDDDYDDGEQPTVEELAAQYGVSPEELLALSEQYEQGEQDEQPDIFDLIDRSVDRHVQAIDAQHALLDRDEDFADLREAMPILQDEQIARAVVNRATISPRRGIPPSSRRPRSSI